MGYLIDKDAKVAVIGHGSWATALVKILLENEKQVGWYVRNPEVLEYLRTEKRNPKYLCDVDFEGCDIAPSDDLNEVVSRADVLVLAIPSAYLKSALSPLTVPLDGKFILSAIKGIVPDDYTTVAEYLNSRYGLPFERIGIVTGPCHAEEVALERLSYLTVVSKDIENARVLCTKIASRYINATPSTDIYGTEYAAVLKNIYALAVGIAVGLGYGDNFLAVLISNGAMEMSRFMSRTFPTERDTNASAYLGDLLVTSYSKFSRNRTFGVMIGKGYSVKATMMEMNMVAEGYFAANCIHIINARHGVQMPIAEAVYDILYQRASPARTMQSLTKKLI